MTKPTGRPRGRPFATDPVVAAINLRLTQTQYDQICKLAQHQGVAPVKLVRAWVLRGLDLDLAPILAQERMAQATTACERSQAALAVQGAQMRQQEAEKQRAQQVRDAEMRRMVQNNGARNEKRVQELAPPPPPTPRTGSTAFTEQIAQAVNNPRAGGPRGKTRPT
jgi:hypothetical protein